MRVYLVYSFCRNGLRPALIEQFLNIAMSNGRPYADELSRPMAPILENMQRKRHT